METLVGDQRGVALRLVILKGMRVMVVSTAELHSLDINAFEASGLNIYRCLSPVSWGGIQGRISHGFHGGIVFQPALFWANQKRSKLKTRPRKGPAHQGPDLLPGLAAVGQGLGRDGFAKNRGPGERRRFTHHPPSGQVLSGLSREATGRGAHAAQVHSFLGLRLLRESAGSAETRSRLSPAARGPRDDNICPVLY